MVCSRPGAIAWAISETEALVEPTTSGSTTAAVVEPAPVEPTTVESEAREATTVESEARGGIPSGPWRRALIERTSAQAPSP